MGLVEEATWAALGYKKVGPGDWLDASKTNILAKNLIPNYNFYEQLGSSNELWIREKCRKKGFKQPELLRLVAEITPTNYTSNDTYEFAELAAMSKIPKQPIPVKWDDLKLMASKIWEEQDRAKAVNSFGLSIFLCDPEQLSAFLQHYALPNFFKAYPNGQVLIYESNYEYEHQYGLIRACYTISHYELTDLSPHRSFDTLKQWHTVDTLTQPLILWTLLGFMFYPYVHIFATQSVGLNFLFLPDKPEEYKLPIFPNTWLDKARSESDFAHQQQDFFASLAEGPKGDTSGKIADGQYKHKQSFTPIEMQSLIKWAVSRFNDLAFHLADPCEFEDNGCIDFVTCFEYGLTVNRTFRKALFCIASATVAERKSQAMEIADTLETLRSVWDSSTGSADFFKRLFHPVQGPNLLKKCLISLPNPFADYFSSVVDELYQELMLTIYESVWVKSKKIGSGVMVKSKDLASEKEEAICDFTSNVIRALRNAHHGYLTCKDPSNRPSRYLSLVDGNTPDSLSYLGFIFVLGMLADPKEMLGWEWMPVGTQP
jgi:hypothetical protein